MKLSDNGLRSIMNWEGTVLHPYKDAVGIWTIGCGHVIKSGESFTTITHEQALELFRNDAAIAERAVNDLVTVNLTQDMFDSLCSFVFNVGRGALKKSTLLRLLNAGDYQGAADQFPKWRVAGSKVLQGLVNRRQAERQTFLKVSVVATSLPPCSGSVSGG